MHHRRAQQSGFTLIEVIVVVSVIAATFLTFGRLYIEDPIGSYRSAYAQAQEIVDQAYQASFADTALDITKQQSVFDSQYRLRVSSQTTAVVQFEDHHGRTHKAITRLPKSSIARSDKCLLYREC